MKKKSRLNFDYSCFQVEDKVTECEPTTSKVVDPELYDKSEPVLDADV